MPGTAFRFIPLKRAAAYPTTAGIRQLAQVLTEPELPGGQAATGALPTVETATTPPRMASASATAKMSFFIERSSAAVAVRAAAVCGDRRDGNGRESNGTAKHRRGQRESHQEQATVCRGTGTVAIRCCCH